MTKVEYFFDCSSPWTYLSFTRIEKVCATHSAELIWKPILVGGVFNAVNQGIYAQRENPLPIKWKYNQKDLADWAAYQGIILGSPPVFPVNSVKAMRGALVAIEEGCISSYAEKVFRTYWTDLKDISQDDVIREIVESVDIEVAVFFEKINSQKYKDQLRANTDELIHREGFGSPTMFINGDDMYFGNDRITLLEHRLGNL